jgi:hypothetical protein
LFRSSGDGDARAVLFGVAFAAFLRMPAEWFAHSTRVAQLLNINAYAQLLEWLSIGQSVRRGELSVLSKL